MSTKLEELSDLEEDIDINEFEDLDYEDEETELKTIDEPDYINNNEVGNILKASYNIVKLPLSVSLISMFMAHPIILKNIESIPYISERIPSNITLGLLIGIIFMIIQRYV
jgi:hypothetical protein